MKNIDQKFSFSFLKTFTEEIFVSLLLLLTTQQLFAQVNEKFDDGNFVENPSWTGNLDRFDATSLELQLKAPPEANISYLATPSSSILDATWQFSIKLQFNPSSSNFARIYLVSDQADLTGSLNGYFVLIGGSSDEISLCKQTGTSSVKLIDGRDGVLDLSTISVTVKVIRDRTGNWDLKTNIDNPEKFISEGQAMDATFLTASYAGIWCKYTATRSDKFFFDDIIFSGDPYLPPLPATWKDVLITEIFADPSPRQELPDYEFVEIFNASENTFNLKDWSLSDGSQTTKLVDHELQPQQYIILTSTAAAENFQSFGTTIGITGFPSLNNSGDNIILKNNSDETIDSLRYDPTWYHDQSKADGGWSLEIIDIKNICGEEHNWAASENDAGGTPGKANSIISEKPDTTPPIVISAIPTSDSTIVIKFDEKLDRTIPSLTRFQLQPNLTLKNVTFTDHTLRQLKVILFDQLVPKSIYTFTISEISDCNGNEMTSPSRVQFALPALATPGDLVVNEILFNPRPNGVDFIEIFNPSDKYINLKSYSLANIDDDQPVNIKEIVAEDLLIHPQQYIVFTTDDATLKSEYIHSVSDAIRIVPEIPSMADDEGTIALVSNANNVIDQLHYSKDMHNPLIKDEEGVSLERINISAPNNAQNWTSAAANEFATPGYKNSASHDGASVNSNAVSVDPEVFNPEYGEPAFTLIHYKFDQPGKIANVKIFDPQGHLIREVANNTLLGTEGFFRWDGDLNNGARARVGYYMVWFEVFDNNGGVQTIRERLAIASQF
jgi:hypothetical protein